MVLSRTEFDAYAAMVDYQSDMCMRAIRTYALGLDWSDRYAAREALAAFMRDAVEYYGVNASEFAAQYYEQIAALSGVDVADAVLIDAPDYEQIQANVAYITRPIWTAEDDTMLANAITQAVAPQAGSVGAGHVNSMAANTMIRNSERDGARFARVPTSATCCAFCRMLASRGFVYHDDDMKSYHTVINLRFASRNEKIDE